MLPLSGIHDLEFRLPDNVIPDPVSCRRKRQPYRTAHLARQFHTSAVLIRPEMPVKKPAVSIDEKSFDSVIGDLFAGQTLTPAEAAHLLKCSVKTIHRTFQHMTGIIPTGKCSYLIPRSLFDSWLRSRMSHVA